ncbi:hypothetical protein OF83DRAFT_928669 [Amylostereum chailletii]|nr:hypothetical protein OF83DRAFT_928669 [Amylostereum chailletii]
MLYQRTTVRIACCCGGPARSRPQQHECLLLSVSGSAVDEPLRERKLTVKSDAAHVPRRRRPPGPQLLRCHPPPVPRRAHPSQHPGEEGLRTSPRGQGSDLRRGIAEPSTHVHAARKRDRDIVSIRGRIWTDGVGEAPETRRGTRGRSVRATLMHARAAQSLELGARSNTVGQLPSLEGFRWSPPRSIMVAGLMC